MKKIFFILILYFLFYLPTFCQIWDTTDCSTFNIQLDNDGECLNGDWTLIYEDEFDGTQLDDSKWLRYYSYGDHCHGNEPQAYQDENVQVNDGILNLTFKHQPDDYPDCGGMLQYREYTSGMIESYRYFSYGIFEAEVLIPDGSNFWPAFWIYCDGEVDFFEFWGETYTPTFNSHKYRPKRSCIYEYKGSGVNYSAAYHKYKTEWDPYFIAYYIDNVLIHKRYRYRSLGCLLDKPCNELFAGNNYCESSYFPEIGGKKLVLNLAGIPNTNPAPLPADMKVKYVRVWTKTDDFCEDISVCHFESDNIKGKSITLSGNITVNSSENKTLTADNYILIKPGLYIQQGATFLCKIDPNLCNETKQNKSKVDSLNDKSKINQFNDTYGTKQNDYISKKNLIENFQNEVLIYPNPASTKITITANFGLQNELLISIFNIQGDEVVSNTSQNKNTVDIDVSSLAIGIYTVKIKTEKTTSIKKLVIQ